MTHGEQWYKYKCYMNSFDCKFDDVEHMGDVIKRMSALEAEAYYSKKCRDVFLSLGYSFENKNSFKDKLNDVCLRVRTATKRMLYKESLKIKSGAVTI